MKGVMRMRRLPWTALNHPYAYAVARARRRPRRADGGGGGVTDVSTPASATTPSRRSLTRATALEPFLVPLASLLVAIAVFGAGPRLLILVALPALAAGAISHRLSRPSAAAIALLLGVLALGAGLIARNNLLIAAGVLFLIAGISRGWGVNRGRRRRRAWTNRILAVIGAVLVGFFVVFPTLFAVDLLAKPRAPPRSTVSVALRRVQAGSRCLRGRSWAR